MFGPGLRKVGQCMFLLFIGNGLAYLTQVTVDPVTPKINRIPLLHMTDVMTELEKGTSSRSRVFDR